MDRSERKTMKGIFLILVFILISTCAYAEKWLTPEMLGKDATVFYFPDIGGVETKHDFPAVKKGPAIHLTQIPIAEDRGHIYESEGAIILKESEGGNLWEIRLGQPKTNAMTVIPKKNVINILIWDWEEK